MKLGVLCIGLLLTGCAAKSAYLPAPEKPDNLNAAVAGVSLEARPDGSCTVTLAIKGAGTGRVDVPRQWCVDAKISRLAAALVPQPTEAPK